MSKFEDIKNSVWNLFRREAKTSNPAEEGASADERDSQETESWEDDNPSMISGEDPRIFGVRRRIVIGIAAGVAATFLIGFFFAANDTPKRKAPMPQPPEINQPKADQNRRGQNTYQNAYGDMAQYDNPVPGKAQPPAGTDSYTRRENKPQPAPPQPASPLPPPQPLPSIQQNPYAAAYGPSFSIPPNAYENLEDPAKEQAAAKSAIAFLHVAANANSADRNGQAIANAKNESPSEAAPSAGISGYAAGDSHSLLPGTLIPAILVTGIDTDAGTSHVEARVQEDVYDSLTGSRLLIARGSRLLGEASASAANGRISINWTTLVLPNGGVWTLHHCLAAMDGAGYIGLQGHVDRHTGRTLTAGALSSGIAALAGIAAGNTSGGDRYSVGQLAAQGAMTNLIHTASSLFQKGMNTTPTIKINPGYAFHLYVTSLVSFSGSN